LGHIIEEKERKEFEKYKKRNEAKQAQDKARHYAQLVKEMHWPKVSEIKKSEMDTI